MGQLQPDWPLRVCAIFVIALMGAVVAWSVGMLPVRVPVLVTALFALVGGAILMFRSTAWSSLGVLIFALGGLLAVFGVTMQ